MAFSLFGKKPNQRSAAAKADDAKELPHATENAPPSKNSVVSRPTSSPGPTAQRRDASASPPMEKRSMEVQEARRVLHPIAE